MRGGRDVEKHPLVRALLVVTQRQFDRVAHITKAAGLRHADLDAARHLPRMDVQTRDYSFRNHSRIEPVRPPGINLGSASCGVLLGANAVEGAAVGVHRIGHLD